jgi:signal transduction histidine kinase/ligand-binding sensor domain-containing protein
MVPQSLEPAIATHISGARQACAWRFARLVIGWFAVCFFSTAAFALDPNKKITQYAHTAWRVQDGFFDSAIHEITQTGDGYLWIGTHTGLLRFDGVRFVPWKLADGNTLSSPRIKALLGASDGSLWIGTNSGLSRFVHGELIQYPDWPGAVEAIVERDDGEIWFSVYHVTDEASWGICKVVGARTQCYFGKTNGSPLTEDGLGSLWTGSGATITRWRPDSPSTYTPHGLSLIPATGVVVLAPARDGSMWVGMQSGGRGAGLQQFINGTWKPFIGPHFDSSTLVVSALVLDRENALWVGTTQGIYRIRGKQFDHFGSSDGLSSNFVQGLFEDREGNVWVGTSLGLDCFRDLPVTTYSSAEGLPPEEVDSVLAARDGTVWISGNQTLSALRQERTPNIAVHRTPGNQVTSLLDDHAGRLWVGIDDRLTIYKDGKFRRIDRPDGKPIGLIVGMTEDVEHNIWAETHGPPRTLFRIQDFKVQGRFPAPQMPSARKIAADPEGGIWLGLISGDLARYRGGKLEIFPFKHGSPPSYDTQVNQLLVTTDEAVLGATNFGLIAWKHGAQRTLRVRNGLPCDEINSLVEDNQGNLWLSSKCGLVEIPRTELQKWWQNPDTIVKFGILNSFDGFLPDYVPFEGAAKSPDGRLWFANGAKLQMIDPPHMSRNLLTPPVHIEEVIADRRSYAPRGNLGLPPITRDLEIDYTALSFVAPEKVLFRYKLEGLDRDWQDASTRRQAFYTNLSPGNYRFRVAACNNSGVWNEAGTFLDFSIAPAYYQTTWFRSLCVAAFIGLLYAFYQLRLRQVAEQFDMRMEERVSERTRIARDLHDTLLQTLHGLMFRFQAARNMFPRRPEEAMQALDGAIMRTEQAIEESRDAIKNLRSDRTTLTDLAESLTATGQELETSVDANGNPPSFRVIVEGERRALCPGIRDELYRIGCELLRNAFRHARARHIEAEIRYDAHVLRLLVRDDGKGMDPKVLKEGGSPGHWGLPGIRERAKQIGAQLDFWSEARAGTEVQLSVPSNIAYRASADKTKFRLFRKENAS